MGLLTVPMTTLLLAAATGCGDRDPEDSGDGPVDDGVCIDLGQQLGESVATGDSTGEGDDWDAYDCGGSSAPDLAWTWTAPETGCFSVDTLAADFDTVLTVLDGECGGPALACNDDYGPEIQSRVIFDALEGLPYTIVVDGFAPADSGAYVLRLVACDTAIPGQIIDLGQAEGSNLATGNNAGEDQTLDSDCGVWGPDVVFAWAPPLTATWRISAVGSDFDTVLSVWDADDDVELACNDDASTDLVSSQLDVALAQDQAVLIGIAGYAGDTGVYVLSIEAVEER